MLPKVKKINLSTQLIDTITALIESGEWELGMKLPNEIDLAASFNVSRNIMRESMKILENFGILESKAGIGTFVSETALSSIHNMRFFDNLKNNSSIENILETRLIIEPELAYYATLRSTEEDLTLLKEIFERNEELHKENQFTKKDDFNFHMFIAKCSQNVILENLCSLCWISFVPAIIRTLIFTHRRKKSKIPIHIIEKLPWQLSTEIPCWQVN